MYHLGSLRAGDNGGSWWEAPLGQVAQATADWYTSEATGVPTFGGAEAYPVGTPGYGYGGYTTVPPAPIIVQPEGGMFAGMGGTGTLALIVAGGIGLAALARRR
jgi:hypothetical protein